MRTVGNILTESDTNDVAPYGWKEDKGLLGASWRLLAGSASVVQSSLYVRRFGAGSAKHILTCRATMADRRVSPRGVAER